MLQFWKHCSDSLTKKTLPMTTLYYWTIIRSMVVTILKSTMVRTPIGLVVMGVSTMFCRWGESVSAESSASKKNDSHNQNTGAIGDKVDLRVCSKSPSGKIVDLLNFEFANNMTENKTFTDHRTILREAKTIIDKFYRSPFIKKRTKRNLRSYAIQITQVEGQVICLRLRDNGLYVAMKLGSLRLPTSGNDLRNARILLERLHDVKDSARALAAIYTAMEHEEVAAQKSLEARMNNVRSPYDGNLSDEGSVCSNEGKDKYLCWIRGSWFLWYFTIHL